MNNRYDLQPELVRYLSDFRCSNELTRSCGQVRQATVVVPQALDLSRVDPSACPYPATRHRSNGVEFITYPPDAAYRDQWLCRVARWQATRSSW